VSAGRDNGAMERGDTTGPAEAADMWTSSGHGDGRGIVAGLARRVEREHRDVTAHRDPDYIEGKVAAVRAYTRYFSPEVVGLEHLPPEGPALLIGNHNALFYMPEAWVTALAIIDRRGSDHPAYTLGYDLLFAIPVVGNFLRKIGAIPASSHEAERALGDGALVLDYPGGDWEACRPWMDRNRVDFGGRTGFVRLALRTGAPVVPVVAQGSHDSVVVLARGERIARALGLSSLRIKVFPIMLGPFGITTVLTPPLPLPSAVTVAFLAPITWPDLGPETADDPEVVGRCAAEVVAAMQAAFDRLAAERPHPVRRGLAGLLGRVAGR